MTEDKWCTYCGYPLRLKRVRDNWGEHLTFYDAKTSNVVEECPSCHKWPLATHGIQSKASADAVLQRLGPYIKPPDKRCVLDKLMEAIGRHPTAESDPDVADAVNAIEDTLRQKEAG